MRHKRALKMWSDSSVGTSCQNRYSPQGVTFSRVALCFSPPYLQHLFPRLQQVRGLDLELHGSDIYVFIARDFFTQIIIWQKISNTIQFFVLVFLSRLGSKEMKGIVKFAMYDHNNIFTVNPYWNTRIYEYAHRHGRSSILYRIISLLGWNNLHANTNLHNKDRW